MGVAQIGGKLINAGVILTVGELAVQVVDGVNVHTDQHHGFADIAKTVVVLIHMGRAGSVGRGGLAATAAQQYQ